jgi:hypothetical protein
MTSAVVSSTLNMAQACAAKLTTDKQLRQDLKACRGRSHISGASPGWGYWERIEGRAARLAEEATHRRFTTSPGDAPALRARIMRMRTEPGKGTISGGHIREPA